MKPQQWVRGHPVVAYVLLTFGISWTGILSLLIYRGFDLAAIHPLDKQAVVGFMLLGPCISGLLMTAFMDGRAGLRELRRRLRHWKVALRWYAVALLTTPLLLLTLLWPLSVLVDPVFAPGFQPALFAIGLIAGGFEEIGWSGFATPRLLKRFSVATAGLALGFVWAGWHLLADLTGNLGTMGMDWLLWFGVFWIATLPAYRLLMTWVYAHTDSLLLAVLMHAGYTGWLFVLLPATSFEQGLVWQAGFAAGLWLAAAVVTRHQHRAGERDSTDSAIGARFTVPH